MQTTLARGGFDVDGTLIGKLLLPGHVANRTFGGPKLNRLFVAAGTSVHSLRVTVNGARYPSPAQPAVPR